MAQHKYEFSYERIILKPLGKEDIEDLRNLRNRMKDFFFTNEDITVEAQKKWYERYLKKENDIMFKAVKKEAPDTFIGTIAIYDIADDLSVAELGRTLVDKEKAPEKGIGTEVTKAACLFAFDVLKINKIRGEVLKSNPRALKMDLNAGFYLIGDYDQDSHLIEMTRETIKL